MKRKAIQLAIYPGYILEQSAIIALCNDGTIWTVVPGEQEWKLMEEPPQIELGDQE